MKSMLTTVCLACSILASRNEMGQAAVYTPRVGQPHVDFLLPTIGSRQPVSLSQYRGKKVLLIHFASW